MFRMSRFTKPIKVSAVMAPTLAVGLGATSPATSSTVSAAIPQANWYYSDYSNSTYNTNCFGYTGTFRGGTRVWVVNWGNDGSGDYDECFGISPGRQIFHAWPGSGAWREMSGEGRADFMWGVGWYTATQRYVWICVNQTNNVFEKTQTSSGPWTTWAWKRETNDCRRLD